MAVPSATQNHLPLVVLGRGGATVPPKAAGLAWRTLRAGQWAHFVLLPAAAALHPLPHATWRAVAVYAAGAAMAALCLAYAYGLNAITDRAVDVSRAKNPLAGAGTVPGSVLVATLCCPAIALAGAWLVGPVSLIAAGISLAAATLYSVGPRLKALPGICTLANLAIFTPLLALGAARPADLAGTEVIVATFVALLVENQLIHEVADRAEDLAGGARTTAGALGPEQTLRLSGLCGAAGAIGVLVIGALSAAAWVGAAGVLAGGGLAASARGETAAAARAGHRSLAMVTGAVLLLLSVGGP